MATVELPDGRIVEDVPDDVTQAQLLDLLSQNGLIDQEQFTEWSAPAKEPTPSTDSVQSRLPLSMRTEGLPATRPETYENLAQYADIPGGIAGASLGAKAGTPFGPAGVFGGTVVGGAAGTFAGSIIGDFLSGDEVDFTDATKDAALSAGIDAATLGAASKFKAVAKALGYGPEEMTKLWQSFTAPPATAPGTMRALPVGSEASLRQTQSVLESGGGSLTAYQTGRASGTRQIMEGIGQIGVFSAPMYRVLEERNAGTISDLLQKLINDSVDMPSESMGALVHGVINAGKDAASTMYDDAIKTVQQKIGNKRVLAKPLLGRLRNFRQLNTNNLGVNLDETTQKIINEWETKLTNSTELRINDLLDMQKRLNTQINQLSEFGQTQNSVASRELAELSGNLRKTIRAMIDNVDPAAGKLYRNANKAFGEAMDGLLPKLNANVIRQADKGDYESIARVLEGRNPDKIEAFIKSIETAFNQAKIAGVEIGDIGTAEAAKAAIRGGFLKNIFGEVTQGGFDPARFANLAKRYEKPANVRAAKAILGNDWPQFKALINAMAESTNKQTGFIGSLVLRSKEAQAAQAGLGGFAVGTGSPLAGGAVFLGPVMLAKIASSPSAVRALLNGNKRANAAMLGGKVGVASSIMEETFKSIMDMLPEEDQAEVRNSMR